MYDLLNISTHYYFSLTPSKAHFILLIQHKHRLFVILVIEIYFPKPKGYDMRVKSHSQATIEKGRKVFTPHKSNGVVDAVLINPPDLSLYLKLQNLLNYFVDCMNNLTTMPENHTECAAHLTRCIEYISKLEVIRSPSFDDDLVRMFEEFIEDAHNFQNIFNAFKEPSTTKSTDQSAAVLLTAKASHLQWLSVRILEDLKNVRSRS